MASDVPRRTADGGRRLAAYRPSILFTSLQHDPRRLGPGQGVLDAPQVLPPLPEHQHVLGPLL